MKLAELGFVFLDGRQMQTLFLETWSQMQNHIILFFSKFFKGYKSFLPVVKKKKAKTRGLKRNDLPPTPKWKYFSNHGNRTFHGLFTEMEQCFAGGL